MKTLRALKSIQAQLLGPLFVLLFGLTVVFIFIAISFQAEYTSLGTQIKINSDVSRYVFEVSRNRALMMEKLVLYRLNRQPVHLNELNRLVNSRRTVIREVPWNLPSNSSIRSLGQSLAGGLEESLFLQTEMIEAIQRGDFTRADEAFLQLSTIFEINSARLKDFSLRIESELKGNERDLKKLLVQIFWTLAVSVTLLGLTIVLIALSYRSGIVRPLRNLHRGLQRLSRGDLSFRISHTSAPVEIEEMVSDFNHMVKSLESNQIVLTRTREEALEAARIKSDFLANMSHEIRTPMNAIIGMADMLMEGELQDEQRRYVRILRNCGQVMLNVVNDILDFSKLERGDLVLEMESFDFRELVSRVAELIEVMATRKGLRFRFSFHADGSSWVRGDSKRTEQIILNILGNAVKFTDTGHIHFTAILGGASPMLEASLHILDSGVGIEEEKLSQIFNRFAQSDTSITRKYGGTGLGLAIVKQLVEAMKGTVSVKSQVKQGTEFAVHLPFAPGVEVKEAAEPNVLPLVELSFREKRILVVDDSEDNRFLIKAYLKSLQSRIEVAVDGKQAIEAFERQEFDLILMDIQMPVLDGYAASARIRELETILQRARTPIFALTAHSLEAEIARTYSVGCDLHLTKPLRRVDLFNAIARFFDLPLSAP